MSVLVELHHSTHYAYDRPVSLGPQIVRLRPAPHCRTPIVNYALTVRPERHLLHWQQDPHSNWLARCLYPEKVGKLAIDVDLIADMAAINPFDFFVEPYAENWPFAFAADLQQDLVAYAKPEPAGPRLREFVAAIVREPRNTVGFLVELNQRLQRQVRYIRRLEPGVQTPDETLAAGAGSCRDSAWLSVQILRNIGLPARFVSGYLIQLATEEKTPDVPAGVAQDVVQDIVQDVVQGIVEDMAELHAWAEAYIPGAGWIGLDATSGLLCGEGHLPLAATPHFRSAAPVTGLVEPCAVEFSHRMNVKRIAHAPLAGWPACP